MTLPGGSQAVEFTLVPGGDGKAEFLFWADGVHESSVATVVGEKHKRSILFPVLDTREIDNMSHVFPRFANIEFPVAVKGDLTCVHPEGSRHLEYACGGAGIPPVWQQREPAVIKAIQDQVVKLEFAYTMFYTNEPCGIRWPTAPGQRRAAGFAASFMAVVQLEQIDPAIFR